MSFQSEVSRWASDRGLLTGSTPAAQLEKLGEEFGELACAVATGDELKFADSVGDIQVVLGVMCGMKGGDVDACRELALSEIRGRTGKLVDGIFVKDS